MDMRRYRLLGWAAYGVALLLILLPILDSFLGVWPFHPEQVTWRFGAVGLFSRAVMTPVLGLLLGIVTAAAFESPAVMRLFSAFSFVGALLALAALGIFILDATQTRTQVVAEATAAFNAASGVAVIKYGLGAVLCALLGIGGWRAARPRRGAERATGDAGAKGDRRPDGMIVGSSRS